MAAVVAEMLVDWFPGKETRSRRAKRPSVSRMTLPREETSSGTDNALLEQAGRGDRDAFGRFYERVSIPLYSLAVQLLGDATEAEDALLEGMEAIWRQAPKFDASRSSAFTWSVMIFRCRVIDRIRKRASQSRTLDRAETEMKTLAAPAGHPASGQDDLVAKKEEWTVIQEAVDSLGPERAQLLRWSFFDGLTHQEISEKAGRPLGTVKTTIRRALLELRAMVSGKGLER